MKSISNVLCLEENRMIKRVIVQRKGDRGALAVVVVGNVITAIFFFFVFDFLRVTA